MTSKVLPSVTKTINREQLIRYAAASGDFNPIHYDTTIARQFGLPGVIAHGMLSMGLLDHLFIPLYNEGYRLREISVRFRQIVRPGETLVFSATLGSIQDGELQAKISIQSSSSDMPKVIGQAIFSPQPPSPGKGNS